MQKGYLLLVWDAVDLTVHFSVRLVLRFFRRVVIVCKNTRYRGRGGGGKARAETPGQGQTLLTVLSLGLDVQQLFFVDRHIKELGPTWKFPWEDTLTAHKEGIPRPLGLGGARELRQRD